MYYIYNIKAYKIFLILTALKAICLFNIKPYIIISKGAGAKPSTETQTSKDVGLCWGYDFGFKEVLNIINAGYVMRI